ncbi:MAG: hypothetical protein U9Q21_04100, partial [Candidatus Auribacterota bacterium]|nr:hypothetical protein [Candidatus Auribacterota bacterium]
NKGLYDNSRHQKNTNKFWDYPNLFNKNPSGFSWVRPFPNRFRNVNLSIGTGGQILLMPIEMQRISWTLVPEIAFAISRGKIWVYGSFLIVRNS